MAFSNKSNKQLIHELQDDLNNINSSSASEISDINGLQAELDSKQQKTGKLQIYDTVFGVNVISTDELTLGSQSGRINLTAHNIYYDIDEAGNNKNLQNEIDSKQQLITSTSELALKKITTENLEVDDNLTVEGDVLLNKSFKIYHAAQAKNVIDYTYDAASNPYMTVDMRTQFQDWITTYGKIYAKNNIELAGANFLIQTSVGANVGRISHSAGVEINTIKSYDTGTLQIDDEVEYKTGNGTYQNLKTKITEIEGDISTLQTQQATDNITASNNLFRLGNDIQMIPGPILNSITFSSENSVPGIIFFDSNNDLLIDAGERNNTNIQPQVKIKRSLIVGESALIEGSLTVNNSIETQRHLALFSDIDQSMLVRLNAATSGDIEFTRNGSLQSLNTILDNINTGGGGSSYTFNSPLNENNGIVTVDLSSKQDALNPGSNISINSLLVGNIMSSVNSGDIKTSGNIQTGNGRFGNVIQNNDYAGFQHSSLNNSLNTEYAIIQNSYGRTILNSKSGQGLYFKISNITKAEITSTGDFVVNQSLRVGGYILPHTNPYLKWSQGPSAGYWHHWRFNWGGSSQSRVYFENLSGDNNCYVFASGFQNPSDDRIKDNEEPIINALDTINKIKPMNYQKYGNLEKTDESILESGVIVQQIYYEVPELKHLITYGEESDDTRIQDLPAEKQFDDLTDEDYEGLGWPAKTCSINYTQFIPWLIKGMQEQQTQINEILSKHNDTTITTFTRDNYLFKFIMPIGKIKIKKAIFEHTDITGAYKFKKLDGTLIGIFDGLKVIESHEFDSNGIVKFLLYDMNNNILPCESGSTDVLIIV